MWLQGQQIGVSGILTVFILHVPKINISIYSMMVSRIMLNLRDQSSIGPRIPSAQTLPTHTIMFASTADGMGDQELQQVY